MVRLSRIILLLCLLAPLEACVLVIDQPVNVERHPPAEHHEEDEEHVVHL